MNPERMRLSYEVWRRRERGESLRAISRTLGIARKTVRRTLRELERRRRQGDDVLERLTPPRRVPRGSKLDPYRSFIADELQRYPKLRATRLHEKLTAQGFSGGYTIVRELLQQLRPKRQREEPFQLVITPPGKQAQVDFSPYKLADGTPLYCFSCVLSHSRYLYAYFTSDMRQPTIFRQLRRAFEAFGGVPLECVFDTMAGIIDRWELDQPVFNLAAVDFAVYTGFALHAAPRGDGAYKGKVERPFRYIEESLLNGRTFHTLVEANDAMAWWLEHRANCRIHRMTKRVPADALAEDRASLRQLPAHPYDDRELAHRLVDSYGYVNFDGNHYRAPVPIGRWVYVRAGEHEVAIVAGVAEVVATHARAARGAGLYVPPPRQRRRRRSLGELLDCVAAWGSSAKHYGEQLARGKRYGAAELSHVVALQKSYTLEDILRAMEHASRYGAYGARELTRILELSAEPRSLEEHLAADAREHIRRALGDSPVRQRSLEEYQRLLAARAPGGADANPDPEPVTGPKRETR
jgi:transposase